MNRLNQLALISLLSLCFFNCSSTNTLTLGTTVPAEVVLSPEVKTIGIINRSLPSETNQKADQIDRVLSAEGMLLDQQGSASAIRALKTALETNGIADQVKILELGPAYNSGLGILPASLDWNSIDEICRVHNVDAIFSLAFYDTETKVDYRLTTMLLPNEFGIKVAVPAHELTLNTLIKNGWRIYDPVRRVLADEFLYRDRVVSVGKGINPVKAYEAIAGRKEAVLQYSSNMGAAYTNRLQPTYERVSRDYFVRGTNSFVVAKRRAQTGDWNGAALLWEKEVKNNKPKIAGRAYYNMAIINEINGDLETAIDWAGKAYSDYNNKAALRYLDALKYRSSLNDELQQQVGR